MISTLSIHPKKSILMRQLGITESPVVLGANVGIFINKLVSKGYTEISVNVDEEKKEIQYHCKMNKERAKKYK